MDNSCNVIKTPVRNGEAAVNGLLAGILAGGAMLLVLVTGGMVAGKSLGEILTHLDLTGSGLPVAGTAAHFSVSAVYGAIYGLLWKITCPFRFPDWLRGTLYGGGLFLAAHFILLPAGSPYLAETPLSLSGMAYLVYGLWLAVGIKQFLKQD